MLAEQVDKAYNQIKVERKKANGPFDEAWQNSDAVLVVEEKQLHVHSTILSLASPVFDKMFNGDFKEAQNKQVCLQGKSYQMVEHLLKLIYPNMAQTLGRWMTFIKLTIRLRMRGYSSTAQQYKGECTFNYIKRSNLITKKLYQ